MYFLLLKKMHIALPYIYTDAMFLCIATVNPQAVGIARGNPDHGKITQ